MVAGKSSDGTQSCRSRASSRQVAFAGDVGFGLEPHSIAPIVQQQLALLRQELNKKAGARTFVIWDFTIVGLDLISAPSRSLLPEAWSFRSPGLPGARAAGQSS